MTDDDVRSSPRDVAAALACRACDNDLTIGDCLLLDRAARELNAALDRCVFLAAAIDRLERGL